MRADGRRPDRAGMTGRWGSFVLKQPVVACGAAALLPPASPARRWRVPVIWTRKPLRSGGRHAALARSAGGTHSRPRRPSRLQRYVTKGAV